MNLYDQIADLDESQRYELSMLTLRDLPVEKRRQAAHALYRTVPLSHFPKLPAITRKEILRNAGLQTPATAPIVPSFWHRLTRRNWTEFYIRLAVCAGILAAAGLFALAIAVLIPNP